LKRYFKEEVHSFVYRFRFFNLPCAPSGRWQSAASFCSNTPHGTHTPLRRKRGCRHRNGFFLSQQACLFVVCSIRHKIRKINLHAVFPSKKFPQLSFFKYGNALSLHRTCNNRLFYTSIHSKTEDKYSPIDILYTDILYTYIIHDCKKEKSRL